MTDLVFLTHAPSRPEWTCVTDGGEWAAGELEGMEEDDLLRRFVLWPTRDDPR